MHKIMKKMILSSLVERLPNIAAVFFDSEIEENVETMAKLEDIDDDCDNNGIPFVKIEDVTKANDEYGLDALPALLYWKNGRQAILFCLFFLSHFTNIRGTWCIQRGHV